MMATISCPDCDWTGPLSALVPFVPLLDDNEASPQDKACPECGQTVLVALPQQPPFPRK